MDNLELNENNCRICLEQPAILDWNEEIQDSSGTTTYKYCYYKYTQLDEDDVADNYSQGLCETCSCELKNFHFLIQKALESYNTIQQTFCQASKIEYKIDIENQIEDATKFETVIITKTTESLDGDVDDDEIKDNFKLFSVETLLEIPKDVFKERVDQNSFREISKNLEKDSASQITKNKNIQFENHDDFAEDLKKTIEIPHIDEEESIDIPHTVKEDSIDILYAEEDTPLSSLADKLVNRRNRKIMCAYCPRLIAKSCLKMHEELHQENRERSVPCKICGLKFFNKLAVRRHAKIHEKNRERRYKCDLCEKAYFSRGELNSHRRIHVGQLIACPICSKLFCRQTDLARHKARRHSNKKETNKKINSENQDDNRKEESSEQSNKKTKNESIPLEIFNDFPANIEVTPRTAKKLSSDISQSAKKPVSRSGRQIMCAHCPKLIFEANMKKHEQTHSKNRERSETCKICGIKLFNKAALRIHMPIHDEKREKRYKCEFCEKAYFNRGALNVHRRLHLGQLIPCPICPKEFYRQVDLEKHKASAHSANIGNTSYKFNKYLVECKECGKSVESHLWKRHSILHSNKFQMKCTLCDKHFASKQSCHKHVKTVHNYKDNVSNVVEYYGEEVNSRTSHLLLSQKESIQVRSQT